MAAKKQEHRNISMTLSFEHWDRYNQIISEAQNRLRVNTDDPEAEIKKQYVHEILFGLKPANAIVTQDNIDFFFGRKAYAEIEIEDLGATSTGNSDKGKKAA